MKLDKKKISNLFPHLTKELESRDGKVRINSVRTDHRTAENSAAREFANYTPDVVDFIRRCDTQNQADEIINYMEKRGEMSREYAMRLRKQLREGGVRSFGPKKEEDYYSKRGVPRQP